jgi:hypothetical protein
LAFERNKKVNKIEYYKKLLEGVSCTLTEAYNKNFNVNLWEEVERMDKSIRKGLFIWRAYLASFAFYFALTIIALCVGPLPWTKIGDPMLGSLYFTGCLIIWFLPIAVVLTLTVRKSNKLGNDASESEKKLKAFEEVIEALDSADLHPQPLRENTILSEVGIRDNILRLVKRLLFAQDLIGYSKKSLFVGPEETREVCWQADVLSRRFDKCIEYANLVGVSISREQAVRDVKKMNGVQ